VRLIPTKFHEEPAPLAPVLWGEGSGVRGQSGITVRQWLSKTTASDIRQQLSNDETAQSPSPPAPLPGVPGRGELRILGFRGFDKANLVVARVSRSRKVPQDGACLRTSFTGVGTFPRKPPLHLGELLLQLEDPRTAQRRSSAFVPIPERLPAAGDFPWLAQP